MTDTSSAESWCSTSPCGFGRHSLALARAGYRDLPLPDASFDAALKPVHLARLPRRRATELVLVVVASA